MDSETTEYDITPVNHGCSNVVNSNVIVSSPGSQTAQANQGISDVNNQHIADAQYDSDIGNVKPLYGGILKKDILFTIKFRNKIVNINAKDENSAIKLFLNNKIYKKDNLLEIIHKNKSSLYIVKNGYKNKFIKCI